jgi:hypothetical protein
MGSSPLRTAVVFRTKACPQHTRVCPCAAVCGVWPGEQQPRGPIEPRRLLFAVGHRSCRPGLEAAPCGSSTAHGSDAGSVESALALLCLLAIRRRCTTEAVHVACRRGWRGEGEEGLSH